MTKRSIGVVVVGLTIFTLYVIPAGASSQSFSGKVLEEEASGEQVVSGAAVTLLDADPFRVTDVLRHVTGFRVVHLGGRKSDIRGIGGRSVPIYINGVPARKFPGETINDILAVGDIGAIEAYWGVSPAQYGGYAAIVIWTR